MHCKGKLLTVIEWIKTYHQKEHFAPETRKWSSALYIHGHVVAYTETCYNNVSSEGGVQSLDREGRGEGQTTAFRIKVYHQ